MCSDLGKSFLYSAFKMFKDYLYWTLVVGMTRIDPDSFSTTSNAWPKTTQITNIDCTLTFGSNQPSSQVLWPPTPSSAMSAPDQTTDPWTAPNAPTELSACAWSCPKTRSFRTRCAIAGRTRMARSLPAVSRTTTWDNSSGCAIATPPCVTLLARSELTSSLRWH